jgi:ribosomal protein L16/L10AE
MGKGKGKFNFWLWKISWTQSLIEISFFLKKKILNVYLKNVSKKLPLFIFLTC